MNDRVLIVIFSLLVFTSCNERDRESGREIERIVNSINEASLELEEINDESTLTVEVQNALKLYFDNIYEASLLLGQLELNRRSKRQVRSHFIELTEQGQICGEIFLTEGTMNSIGNLCREGSFNLCPFSMNFYRESKIRVLSFLEEVLEEYYIQTDCEQS